MPSPAPENPLLHRYEVGKPYLPEKIHWPETAKYSAGQGEHKLLLFFRSPSAAERRDAASGVAEFALVDLPSVLFFLYRVGERIGWSNAPYNVHLEPAEQRVEIPSLAPEQRLPLTLLLIDAATGIVQVNRSLTLSHEFGVTLHDALHAQLAAPFDRTTYHQACTAAYNRFPTTQLLLNQAIARSQAGE